MGEIMYIRLSRIGSSNNYFKASFYDPVCKTSYFSIFKNNVEGFLGLGKFLRMIKSIFESNGFTKVCLDSSKLGIITQYALDYELLNNILE